VKKATTMLTVTEVDVTQIYKLVGKVFLKDSFIGIVFTTHGLTGNFQKDAVALVKQFWDKLHVAILWFTLEDWQYLINYPDHFVVLFLEKIERFFIKYNCDIDFDSRTFRQKVDYLNTLRAV
jgi:hypothetical protein